MKILKLLKSKNGFSFVEVLMAIGVLGIGVVASINLSQNSLKESKLSDFNATKISLINSLNQYISSNQVCDSIGGLSFTNSSWSPLSLNISIAGVDAPNLAFAAGRKFKHFEVGELSARTSGNLPGPNNTIQKTLDIKLKLKNYTGNKNLSPVGNVDRFEEFFFSVPVLTDAASGKISKCRLEQSLEGSCAAIGGTYDINTSKCEPKANCEVLGSYTDPSIEFTTNELPSNSLHQNTVFNSDSCGDGQRFQTGQINYVYQAPGDGKKSSAGPLQTQIIKFYTCVKCSPGGTTGATGGPTGGGGGGGGRVGCFVAGTEISMFDGSKKAIEDVNLGDELIDVRGNKVTADELVRYNYNGPVYSINGGPYFFTPNHPFLTLDGWKSLEPGKSMKESPGLIVSMMRVGDVLIKTDGYEVIMSLDSIHATEKVYNFSVSGLHEYVANEYAVHNLIPVAKK